MYNVIFSEESNGGLVASINNTASCAALGYSDCFSNNPRILSVYPGATPG